MKFITPLLGYLGKSSRNSTPEADDTNIKVPGLFSPVVRVPFPFFTFFNAPLPGGANQPVNSWYYQQEYLYNVTTGLVIAQLSPGLWNIRVYHDKVRAGAVNDITSSNRLDLVDNNTALTVTLTKILNDVAVPETYSREIDILVPTDQNYSLVRNSLVGAGTGTCLSNLKIIATRLM